MIDEIFELKGKWFLPNKPNKSYYGTLRFDSKSKIELELLGNFRKKINQHFETNIILGETTNGKQITLYKCFEIKFSMHFPGTPTQKINVMYLFEGVHFSKESDMKFNKLSSELLHLNEWLGISGFMLKQKKIKNFTYNLNYKLPKQIQFPIDSNVMGKFYFTAGHPGATKIYDYKLYQNSKVTFETISNQLDFSAIMLYLHHFQDFITLGTYEISYPKSIVLYSNNYKTKIGNRIIDSGIKLYYNISIPTKVKQKILWQFLFNYNDIKPYFKRIIKKWYENKTNLDPINKILMETFYNKGVFSENRFLNIVQALETFHRRTRKNNVIPDRRHKKRISEIINSIPSKHREFLNNRLIQSNEPSLHTRLEKLINEFNTATFNKIVSDKALFIKQTKDSRNYYTHYDPKGKNKALAGAELYYLTEKLKIVLVSAILRENGFSFNRIQNLLSKNEYDFFNHIL